MNNSDSDSCGDAIAVNIDGYPLQRITETVIWALTLMLIVLCTTLHVFCMREHPILKRRQPEFLFLGVFCLLLLQVFEVSSDTILSFGSCDVAAFFLCHGSLFGTFPYAIRIILYHNQYLKAKTLSGVSLNKSKVYQSDPLKTAYNLSSPASRYGSKKVSSSPISQVKIPGLGSNKKSDKSFSLVQKLYLALFRHKFQKVSEQDALGAKLALFASSEYGIFLFSLALMANFSFYLGLKLTILKDCSTESALKVLNFTMILSFLLYGYLYFICWSVRNEPDVFQIVHETRRFVIDYNIFKVFVVALYIVNPFCIREKKYFSMKILVFAILVSYVCWFFLLRPLIQLRKVKELGSDSAKSYSLKTILTSELGTSLFKEHLMAETNYENFLFYQDAEQWKKNQQLLISSEIQVDFALKLYNRYICDEAVLQINVDHFVRQDIESRIMDIKNNGSIAVDETLFDEAREEVWALLEQDVFPRFISSNRFKEHFLGKETQ